MTDSPNVDLTFDKEFAVMTLNRPEALNALSFAIIREIGRALDQVSVSDARALLIMGAGDRAFCAGADIEELTGRSLEQQKADAEIGQATFERIAQLPMPSIAIINGFAFGGGLELAMSCTFRIATGNAKMGLPEIKLGLVPGYGGTQRLPRLIGEGRALDMILTGRTVETAEALSIGLVNRSIDDDQNPLQAGKDFARTVTQYSLPVLKLSREAVTRAASLSMVEGLKVEADLSTLAFQTEDANEGMTAFQQKRKANFKDA